MTRFETDDLLLSSYFVCCGAELTDIRLNPPACPTLVFHDDDRRIAEQTDLFRVVRATPWQVRNALRALLTRVLAHTIPRQEGSDDADASALETQDPVCAAYLMTQGADVIEIHRPATPDMTLVLDGWALPYYAEAYHIGVALVSPRQFHACSRELADQIARAQARETPETGGETNDHGHNH